MKKHHLVFIIFTLLFAPVLQTSAQDDCDDNQSCVEVSQISNTIGLTESEILNADLPQFDSPLVNQSLLHDRRYQQVTGTVQIFDSPDGSVLRVLDDGFNFVTVLNVQENGWTQINAGEWIRSEHLTDTNYVVSEFNGIFLPEIMPQYTIAWMLVNAYPSTVPGGDPLESNGLIYRYTQVYIYDSVELDEWRWYQIGANKWVHQTAVAKVQPIERPEDVNTERWVSIDLYEQTLVAYEGETPIFATLVATGLPRWPTFEGTFNIYYRNIRHDMSWGTPGDDFYYLEEVPWTMFFDEGRALHGAYWHDGLGYRRSHGCVNMSLTDANWLYNWVAQDFDRLNSPDVEEGPAVHVYSSDQYR